LERGDKEAWGVDSAATPLPLGSFAWNAYKASITIDVANGESKRFSYAGAKNLHRRNGKAIASLHTFQNGDHLVLIGRDRFSAEHAWQLHLSVPGDVGDVSEVQHHPQVPDQQPDGTGLVPSGENPYPLYDVTSVDEIHRLMAEGVEEHLASDPVGGEGAVSDTPAGSQPLSVSFTKEQTAFDGTVYFGFRVLRGGKPVAYQITSDEGFFFGAKRTSVLYLAIPPSPAVADVESSSVPGVPSTNVESRHLEAALPSTFYAGRPPLERVEKLVAAWQRCIAVNAELEGHHDR
jgi:hypothetical protein